MIRPRRLFRDISFQRSHGLRTGLAQDFLSARGASVILFRLAQALQRCPALASACKQINQMITGADIAWQAQIGEGLTLFHPNGVVIGPHVRVGRGCQIQQGVTLGSLSQFGADDSPQLGDDVQLGAGARVLGGIAIGDRARVGANAVVLSDVPPDATAVGVPARVILPGS